MPASEAMPKVKAATRKCVELDDAFAEGVYEAGTRAAAQTREAQSKQTCVQSILIALLYAHANDPESSLKWLQNAYDDRDPHMVHLAVEPD